MHITHIRIISIGSEFAAAAMRSDAKIFPRRKRRARIAKNIAWAADVEQLPNLQWEASCYLNRHVLAANTNA